MQRNQLIDEAYERIGTPENLISQETAFERGEFEVWYQPKFDHSKGTLTGAEALIRWRHPVQGVITPDCFIESFEKSGFIYQLDQYVWEQVCTLLEDIKNTGYQQFPISVNLSAYDLKQEDMVSTLKKILAAHDIEASLVPLEINEAVLNEADEDLKQLIKELRDSGFKVIIDRFAGHYGSLNMLRNIPADAIKFDVQFIEDRADSDRSGNLSESVIRMARWIGLSVMAVGVDNLQDADFLKTIGCCQLQGYLYSKPLPQQEFSGLVKQQIHMDQVASIEIMETYDSEMFWNPKSLDTLIFNSFVGGACIFEYQNGRIEIIRANDKYVRILCGSQLHSKDALHIEWEKYIVPKSRVSSQKAIQQAIDTGSEVADEMELCGFRKPGETVLVRATMRVIANIGEKYLFYCILEDITDLRAAEKKEKQLRQLLKMILDNVGSGITATILNQKSADFLFANEAYYDMLGYTKEQYYNEIESPYRTIHPDDRDRVLSSVRGVVEDDKPLVLEYRIVKRDGSIRNVRMVTSNKTFENHQDIVQLSVYSDVTDEKKEEEQQKELLDNLPCGAGIFDISNGTIHAIYLNKKYWMLVGRLPQDTGSMPVLDSVQMEDRAYLPMVIQRIVLSGKEQECEVHVIHGDGHYVPFLVRGNVTKHHSGRMTLYVTYTPIEEKTLTYRQMLPVALEAMLSSSTDLTFVKDRTFAYVCASRAYAKLVGYDDERELIGKTDYDLFDRQYANQYRADDQELLRNGKSLIDYIQNITNRDGVTKYCSKSKYLLRDTGDNVIGIYGVCRDITEAKETSDKLSLLENEILNKYEHELQLRKGLVQEAFLYYQWNLTTGSIEDYASIYPDFNCVKVPISEEVFLREAVAPKIWEADLEKVKSSLYGDALRDAHQRGERNVSCIYRRRTSNQEYHWVRMEAFIMDKPRSEEVVAFLHCRDIDQEQKKNFTIDKILDEDIESIIHVDIQKGNAAIIHMMETVNYNHIYAEFSYLKECQIYAEHVVAEEDREAFLNFYSVENLTEMLQHEKQIDFTFRLRRNGIESRKQTKAYYLDEFRQTVVLIRRDITKIYEEEQQQNRRLQEAVETANDANRAKSDFLSHMSHDIRTPLNAVLAFSNPELVEGADREKLQNYLDKVHISGNYLLGIINDVLDMSRIEQNRIKLNPEPYYLSDFENTIRNVIGELSHNRNINFVMDISQAGIPGIITDSVRFNQIFINLLSNAVKFTGHGGTVEFIIEETDASNPDHVWKHFIVRDNGIGMSEDFIPHAFDSFNQEYRKDTSERNQGTGLGLAIVKELVKMFGGTIHLESRLNVGTTFTVDLPFQTVRSTEKSKDEEEHDYSCLNGVHILLTEDNDINTEIARALLEKYGCLVERAENGEEALRMFADSEEGQYQLILMDIRMPVMDGLTATRKLRALKREDVKLIPIIAMTADAFNEDEQVAYHAGMNAHVAKPIDPAQLYDTCCRLLSQK